MYIMYSKTLVTRDCEISDVAIIEFFLLKIRKKKFENQTNNKGVKRCVATHFLT